mmetsp:Transcript_7165/g.14782  ORF Transcript_7165/g.14782 Transcript_7165/m.14782 type:complete len:202 (-) Transcript_7165:570-1175(-)
MRQPATLWGVNSAFAPYQSVIEVSKHLRRNVGTQRFNCGTLSDVRQDNRFIEIRRRALSLCIDSGQSKIFPHLLFQCIVFQRFTDVPLFVDTSNNGMWLAGKLVNFLDRDGIDFVVQIQGWFVLAIAKNDVHQLIDSDFFSGQNIGTRQFVLPENLRDNFFRFWPELCLGDGTRKSNSASQFSLGHSHIGWPLIEADPHGF